MSGFPICRIHFLFLFLLLIVSGCEPKNQPDKQEKFPVSFVQLSASKVTGDTVYSKEPITCCQSQDSVLEKPFFVEIDSYAIIPPPASPQTETKRMKKSGERAEEKDESGSPKMEFETIVEFGGAGVIPDVSVATHKDLVLMSYNTGLNLSKDGGQTFIALSPNAVFPKWKLKLDNGKEKEIRVCCDQVVIYVPAIDRFIWLMQFCTNAYDEIADNGCSLGGLNLYRVAAASPEEILASNGTAWTYWDFTGHTIGGQGVLDYPDLSVGIQYLYISATANSKGLVVMRMPLKQIQSGEMVDMGYTTADENHKTIGAHLCQNTQDAIFWAGHKTNTTMQIFSWRETDDFFTVQERAISPWPGGMNSTTPSGVNWLSGAGRGFPGNAVLGATRAKGEIWFAWTANAGGSFPNAHVQIVCFDDKDFSLKGQRQIWNKDFAFAYPALTTNSAGEVGISLGWGGNTTEAHHAAGIWGDFVLYYPRLSSQSLPRYGDYVSIRPYEPDSRFFSAGGYTTQAGGQQVLHYLKFGRP